MKCVFVGVDEKELPEDWSFYVTELMPNLTGLSFDVWALDVPLFNVPCLMTPMPNEIKIISFEEIQKNCDILSGWLLRNKQALMDHWNQETSSSELSRRITK